jgi:hypothetical protein
MNKYILDSIQEHANTLFNSLPNTARGLIHAANLDLYFGPNEPNEDYPGFTAALDAIFEALENLNITDVYVDECGILECEPESYFDEDSQSWVEPENYYLIEAKDIIRKIVGKELIQYI